MGLSAAINRKGPCNAACPVDVHAELTQGFHQELTRVSESQYSYVFVDKSSVSSVLVA